MEHQEIHGENPLGKLMGNLVTCLKQRHVLGGFEQDRLLRTSCHGGLQLHWMVPISEKLGI